MPEKMFIAVDSMKLKFGSSKKTLKVASSMNCTRMSLPVTGDFSTAGRPGINSLLSIRSSRAKRTSSIVCGYPSDQRAPFLILKVNSSPRSFASNTLKALGTSSNPSGDISRPSSRSCIPSTTPVSTISPPNPLPSPDTVGALVDGTDGQDIGFQTETLPLIP